MDEWVRGRNGFRHGKETKMQKNNAVDSKIKKYLERAIKMVEVEATLEQIMDLASPSRQSNVIEIAKMIQKEEHEK